MRFKEFQVRSSMSRLGIRFVYRNNYYKNGVLRMDKIFFALFFLFNEKKCQRAYI